MSGIQQHIRLTHTHRNSKNRVTMHMLATTIVAHSLAAYTLGVAMWARTILIAFPADSDPASAVAPSR